MIDQCTSGAVLVSDEHALYSADSYFGNYSAVAFIDVELLDSCADALRDLSNPKKGVKSAIELRVVTSMTSKSFVHHFARFEFERPTWEVYEHYFVSALELSQALDLFVDTALQHAVQLHDGTTPHFVKTVICSHLKYSMAEVKGNRHQVAAELKNAVRSKVTIPVGLGAVMVVSTGLHQL